MSLVGGRFIEIHMARIEVLNRERALADAILAMLYTFHVCQLTTESTMMVNAIGEIVPHYHHLQPLFSADHSLSVTPLAAPTAFPKP